VRVTGEVQSVDPRTGKVVFLGPDGQPQTVVVEDPELRDRLRTLARGDTVDVTYRQATAISLAPANPGAP